MVIIAAMWLLAATPAAQTRPYDVLMKDVASTVEGLRKGLNSGDLTGAAATAGRLERLFVETEAFWAPFRTKDALDAARGARGVAVSIAAAIKGKDAQKAKDAAAGLGRFCTACHNSHREQMPDKSYRIRP